MMTMMMIYILVPLVVLIAGVWIGIRYSRDTRKDVDTDIPKHTDTYDNTIKEIGEGDTGKQIAKGFEEVLRMMRDKLEKEQAEERDEELIRYAKDKLKNQNPVEIKVSRDNPERRADVGRNANIAIPYNMNEMDKRILESFYGNKDLEL